VASGRPCPPIRSTHNPAALNAPSSPDQEFGNAFDLLKRNAIPEAKKALKKLLKRIPRHFGGLNLLGVIHLHESDFSAAADTLARAVEINAQSDATFNNLALALKSLSRRSEAIVAIDKAIGLSPRTPDFWNLRGLIHSEMMELDRAARDFDRAIELNPKFAVAFYNKGNALLSARQYDDACTCFRDALSIETNHAQAWYQLGVANSRIGRYPEALDCLGKVIALAPEFSYAKGHLLHHKMLLCDWEGYSDLADSIKLDLAAGKCAAEPFGFQAISDSAADLKRCAELYSIIETPRHSHRLPAQARAASEKIKIGYLSGEFRDQATSRLMVELLELHDKNAFEIDIFDNGWDDGSDIRKRIDAACAQIFPISNLSDDVVAGQIRERGIHILVNLNGFFGLQRNNVFNRKPAPIQVSYLGFPGTLGVDYLDYIIADRVVIPETDTQHYNEKVVYLPNCYQINDRKRKISAKAYSRSELELPEQGVVFCCFNNTYKITPAIFERWMRILRRVDLSVLWLYEAHPVAAENLRQNAKASGIHPGRIVFAKFFPLPEHLARLQAADLFLDTLPYNAHTTGSDALWSGVPVLTCAGTTFPGRVGSSLLHAVGLPELITANLDQYEEAAVRLASESDVLTQLKQKLRQNRLECPLFDSARTTLAIESAFKTMFETWMAGRRPESFSVQ
jgi:predicted O-linked N-acetylglucosamine transferase (SPINDLY family)